MNSERATIASSSSSLASLSASKLFILFLFLLQVELINCYTIDLLLNDTKCLSCIRNVSSQFGSDVNKRCEGYYCGQYQLSYTYWAEAGKPGNNQGAKDYEKCARDKTCAEQTVRAYFKKFKRDCNHDGIIDCLDMAALHKGGPNSCSSDWFYKSRYWLAFNKTSCATGQPDEPTSSSSGGETTITRLELEDAANKASKVMRNQSLTPDCLDCICDAVSGCNTSVNNCNSGTVCGPFAISQAYWKDGRKPGASWTACTRTKECSSVAMKNYMEKYKKDCNGDGFLTCEDYAAIHRRGPRACSNKDLLKDHYWNKFLACRASQKPNKDVNMVKVIDNADNQLANQNLNSRVDSNELLLTSTTESSAKTESSTTLWDSHKSSAQSTNPAPTTSIGSSSSQSSKFEYAQTPSYEPTSLSGVQVNTKSNHLIITQSNPIDVFADSKQRATSNSPLASEQSKLASPMFASHESPPVSTVLRRPADYSELQVIRAQSSTWRPTTQVSSEQFSSSWPQEATLTDSSKFQRTSTAAVADTTIMLSSKAPQILRDSKPNLESVRIEPIKLQPNSEVAPAMQPVDSTPVQSQNNQQTFLASSQDDADYPNPDYASQSQSSNSFDKVVIGIVGNPDFGKSYPPMPDLGSKVQSVAEEFNNNHQVSGQTKQSQQKFNTNHFKASGQDRRASLEPHWNPKHKSEPTSEPPKALQEPKSTELPQPQPESSQQSEQVKLNAIFDRTLNETGSRLASECLECICDASSNCDTTVQCISKQREKNRCGLYMISWNQFQESDISLAVLANTAASSSSSSSSSSLNEDAADEKLYYDCATDKSCAEKLIHLYVEKHQRDCNNDGKIDCYDIAAIHRVGPQLCNSGKFLSSQYWKDFNICYASSDRLTTTIQP